MNKILGIVVLGLLLCGSTYAENLGTINVKELTKLKTKQIIEYINYSNFTLSINKSDIYISTY